jgi:hypothetical protein
MIKLLIPLVSVIGILYLLDIKHGKTFEDRVKEHGIPVERHIVTT